MKITIHRFLLLTVALAAVVFVGCFSSGCSFLSGKAPKAPIARTALAMKETWLWVDGFARAYADACAAGQVTVERQAKVDAAHEAFRQRYVAVARLAGAVAGLEQDLTTLTPEDLWQLAFDFVALCQAFGISAQPPPT